MKDKTLYVISESGHYMMILSPSLNSHNTLFMP